MDEGEERDKFIELITVQMKKNYLVWNKDNVDNKRIFEDLRTYSEGKIDITDGEIKIQQSPRNDNSRNNKRKKVFKKKH